MKIIRTCSVLLLAIFIFQYAAGEARATLSISPAFVDLTLDKGRPSGQFQISNVGDEEERYRIKAIHFIFLEDGGFREIPPDEKSLAQWVRFNPKEFVLPPQSKQTIRFTISTQGKLNHGEYWGAMELESLKTTFGKGTDPKGRQMSIEVIPTILVPIFGKVGTVRYQADLKETKIITSEQRNIITSLITNTGEGRLFLIGQFIIKDLTGNTIQKGSLGRAYVLPGADRWFKIPLEEQLPPGQYIIKVEYTASALAKPIAGESPLVWEPKTP